ncbi:MAG: hypothetical protein QXL77_03900 [Candidatus Bathyarchaeia archaeon]
MKNEKIMQNEIRKALWMPKKHGSEIEDHPPLTRQKEVRLKTWQEIRGVLKKVEITDKTTKAILTCTKQMDLIISYPNKSAESRIIQKLRKLKGKRVSILKTDLPYESLIVRTVSGRT